MLGCSPDSTQLEQGLMAMQDLFFEMFHDCEFETISDLLTPDFSYADGASRGKAPGFPKRLERVYKYQERNDMLPLSITDRTAEVSCDIGWIAARLQSEQARTPTPYGSLTQVFRIDGDRWKLVRHHFSPAVAPIAP
jgi:ketosteroid isomerase-like protein